MMVELVIASAGAGLVVLAASVPLALGEHDEHGGEDADDRGSSPEHAFDAPDGVASFTTAKPEVEEEEEEYLDQRNLFFSSATTTPCTPLREDAPPRPLLHPNAPRSTRLKNELTPLFFCSTVSDII